MPLTTHGACQYHALPGNGHPQALVRNARMNPVVAQSKCLTNMIEGHQDITNLAGKMTQEARRIFLRNCVKTGLFSLLKFFKKDLHGIYADQRETTVWGLVIKSCNLSCQDATLEWWATMRKIVVTTHPITEIMWLKLCACVFEMHFGLVVIWNAVNGCYLTPQNAVWYHI